DQRRQRLSWPRHGLPAERSALGRGTGAAPGALAAGLYRRPDRPPAGGAGAPRASWAALGPARPGTQREVIVAVGPAFGVALTQTIGGLKHADVLAAILTGVAREGLTARIVRVCRSSDLAAIS